MQFEVFSPDLPARVKKGNELAGLHVKCAHLAGFVAIALKTRPSQVLVIVPAAVFSRNDVIRLMMFRGYVFGKQTILTTPAGAVSNSKPLRLRYSHEVSRN